MRFPPLTSSFPTFLIPVLALLRQTNPNWRAMFTLVGANHKFAKRMEAILGKYEDVRLTLLPGRSKVSGCVCCVGSTYVL